VADPGFDLRGGVDFVFGSEGKIPGGKKPVIQVKYIEMHLFAVILTKKIYNLYWLPNFF